MNSIKSNSFYLTSNQMYSGRHISRLAIRSVLNGYQYYKIGDADRVVKKDNYLIVNEGQEWSSAIETEMPVEMMVVAFHPEFVNRAIYSWTASTEKLLDDPFFSENKQLNYFENTYPNDEAIFHSLAQLKQGILRKEEELFFEQAHFNLLELIFRKHQASEKQMDLIPAKKAAVKKELFLRLGTAKDYMDAHLGAPLDLAAISQIAALSPFHFLRLFKALYQTTPHQYLTKERMKRGHYLLQNSSKTIREISFEVGFENHSAFGRLFKNYYGLTPQAVRIRK